MTKRKYVRKETKAAEDQLQVVQNDNTTNGIPELVVEGAPEAVKSYKFVVTLSIKGLGTREANYTYPTLQIAQIQHHYVSNNMSTHIQKEPMFTTPDFGVKCELIEWYTISPVAEE